MRPLRPSGNDGLALLQAVFPFLQAIGQRRVARLFGLLDGQQRFTIRTGGLQMAIAPQLL